MATKITTIKQALAKFGQGASQVPGVELRKLGGTSYGVFGLNEEGWFCAAHFTSKGEVLEWANRF